jgi:hypothetical protein
MDLFSAGLHAEWQVRYSHKAQIAKRQHDRDLVTVARLGCRRRRGVRDQTRVAASSGALFAHMLVPQLVEWAGAPVPSVGCLRAGRQAVRPLQIDCSRASFATFSGPRHPCYCSIVKCRPTAETISVALKGYAYTHHEVCFRLAHSSRSSGPFQITLSPSPKIQALAKFCSSLNRRALCIAASLWE